MQTLDPESLQRRQRRGLVRRALEQFQDTVIDRLFVLNAERAAEEKRLGLAKPSKGKKAAAKNTSKGRKAPSNAPAKQTELDLDGPPGEDR